MAIPGWLWPQSQSDPASDRSTATAPSSPPPSTVDEPLSTDTDPSTVAVASLSAADLDAASSVFGVLSDSTRLEIVATLHAHSEPVSYTQLRQKTAVDDKGRFNYHLRQLDRLVESVDGSYMLNQRGTTLAERLVAGPLFRDE